MEATTLGINRTGAAISPEGTRAMTEAVNEIAPPGPIDKAQSEMQRIVYINEAEAVGSIPPPPTVKGMMKSGVAALSGGHPSIFMDKIGERIAFERGGTRIYDALIVKYNAVASSNPDALPPAPELLFDEDLSDDEFQIAEGESPAQTLARIRAEELSHFQMLCAAMETLGGDPTAQTPCADVIATASMGLMQVVTDPRTTLAQSLNAVLTAELTDNAGWELLIQLAEDAGETELTGQFLGALSQEQEHLMIVKAWVTALVSDGVGTPAV